MTETPKETSDVSLQGRFNGIVVMILVVVGLLGGVWMFRELYQPAPPAGARPQQQDAPGVARPAVATPAEAPAGTVQYALQLSPFSDVATAEDLRGKLEKLGIASTLSVEARVQVGPFKTQAEVDAARIKLKEMGIYGGKPVTIKN